MSSNNHNNNNNALKRIPGEGEKGGVFDGGNLPPYLSREIFNKNLQKKSIAVRIL